MIKMRKILTKSKKISLNFLPMEKKREELDKSTGNLLSQNVIKILKNILFNKFLNILIKSSNLHKMRIMLF